MRHRFTLDVPSFEKLLSAAWVLQCQRDRELSDNRDGALGASHEDELQVAVTPGSQGNGSDGEGAVVGTDTPRALSTVSDLSPVPGPMGIAPIYQPPEIAGGLALDENCNCSSVPDPIPTRISETLGKALLVETEVATVRVSGQPASSRVRVEDGKPKDAASILRAINSKRALSTAAASVEPLLVLLIMVVFLLSELSRNEAVHARPRADLQTSQTAIADPSTRDNVGQAQSEAIAGTKSMTTDQFLPPLEPSHKQVTDPATSAIVEALSRYEIKALRRQAEYGDEVAAMTLGMAYEIGRHVPQSCTKATNWVSVAAEENNPAAQYNLALRYLYGDGIPPSSGKAKKWLQKAASHGYRKADFVLQSR